MLVDEFSVGRLEQKENVNENYINEQERLKLNINADLKLLEEQPILKQKLIEFYNATPRLIYVGEWHTHPDGIPSPSSTDLNAMIEIAESHDVSIENPILMILGVSKTEMKLGTFVYSKNKLLKYE